MKVVFVDNLPTFQLSYSRQDPRDPCEQVVYKENLHHFMTMYFHKIHKPSIHHST